MSDNMDKPSKHGLRRPPNDGAPRPNPPRPWPKAGPPPDTVDVRAAKLASRCGTEMVNGRSPRLILMAALADEHAQGELDGLRKAATIMCYDCDQPQPGATIVEPAIIQGGRWVHPISGMTITRYCRSGRIHDLINDIERHGA